MTETHTPGSVQEATDEEIIAAIRLILTEEPVEERRRRLPWSARPHRAPQVRQSPAPATQGGPKGAAPAAPPDILQSPETPPTRGSMMRMPLLATLGVVAMLHPGWVALVGAVIVLIAILAVRVVASQRVWTRLRHRLDRLEARDPIRAHAARRRLARLGAAYEAMLDFLPYRLVRRFYIPDRHAPARNDPENANLQIAAE